MEGLSLLRRLAEQHNYAALHEACTATGSDEPALQVLLALAEVHLGEPASARRTLASLDRERLAFDVRVDLAAVHMALGEVEAAVEVLETAGRPVASGQAGPQAAPPPSASADNAGHALLLARLAWCRLQQGQRDDALVLYERSLTLRPFLAVYENLLGLYRDSGRLTDMARCLDAAWRFWAEEQSRWPAPEQSFHSRKLRTLQLELWLAEARFEAVEVWVDGARETLSEDDWCALLIDLAARLAARNRHTQAEDWLRSGLRHYPEHVALYRELADLADEQGRTLQAMTLLRRAIALAGAHQQPTAGLWIRLSSTALPAHPKLARQAAEQALGQLAGHTERPGPGDDDFADLTCQAETALAGVERRERDYQAAERRYRQVLEQQPLMVPALHGLGQLLMQLGRIDEAVTLFERITAVDPARGHGALIAASRIPEDDDTLHRLERLARTDGPLRAGMLFHLAAAWEKRGEYARAFALADEANSANRALLRYDPKAHRQRCARIRHAFPGTLYEHRQDCGHESTLPVFVVGMPRSGTTLIEQIVAGHSRIHGAGELEVIPRVVEGLERWERHTGSGRRYPDCVDDLDPTVTRGIAERVHRELREYAPEADHVVDKLPHNFENVGLIRLLFPRSKVISVRRDPRDIAVSSFFLDFAGKHGAMGFAYDLEWIGEQLADHNLLMHHWQQVWPEGILEIHYEDVVDAPEASARRMLEHIGVEWEPQVLDFDALERPVTTASVWQVRQPLYASSKGRWQRYRQHLSPLIAGTNRKIRWDPIEMVTLPEPGWLNAGVDHFRQGDLSGAERRFKQLLHHLPEHAAARFMLGLVYVRKGHPGDGIPLMEQALERCPWNCHWRDDLARAYRLDGRTEDAAALTRMPGYGTAPPHETNGGKDTEARLDYLFLSAETTCATDAPEPSGSHC